MEIIAKKTDYLEFIFDIQIKDLKNYKNLISELKLKEYKFKINTTQERKMLSYNESLKILKETNALLEGHFILSSGLHSDQYVQCAKLFS